MGRFIAPTVTRQSNNCMEVLPFTTQSVTGGSSVVLSTFDATSGDVKRTGKAMGMDVFDMEIFSCVTYHSLPSH